VNQILAQHYWPGQDPIGKTVLLMPPESLLVAAGLAPPGFHPQQFTVVGVAADVRYGGMDHAPLPLVYASILQHDFSMDPSFTVHTEGDP
jgi:hypothetical protein